MTASDHEQTRYTTLTGLHVYRRGARDYALIRSADEWDIIGEISKLAASYAVLLYADDIAQNEGYARLRGRRFETLTDAIAAACEEL